MRLQKNIQKKRYHNNAGVISALTNVFIAFKKDYYGESIYKNSKNCVIDFCDNFIFFSCAKSTSDETTTEMEHTSALHTVALAPLIGTTFLTEKPQFKTYRSLLDPKLQLVYDEFFEKISKHETFVVNSKTLITVLMN